MDEDKTTVQYMVELCTYIDGFLYYKPKVGEYKEREQAALVIIQQHIIDTMLQWNMERITDEWISKVKVLKAKIRRGIYKSWNVQYF